MESIIFSLLLLAIAIWGIAWAYPRIPQPFNTLLVIVVVVVCLVILLRAAGLAIP